LFLLSYLDIFLDTLGTVSDKQGGMFHQDVHIIGQRYQELRDPAIMGDVIGVCKEKMKPFTKGQNNFMCIKVYPKQRIPSLLRIFLRLLYFLAVIM
jgi:hypothetical protein